MHDYLTLSLSNKYHLFSNFLKFDQPFTQDLLITVFKLIEKHYPGAQITRSDLGEVPLPATCAAFIAQARTLVPVSDTASCLVEVDIPLWVKPDAHTAARHRLFPGLHFYYGLEKSIQRNSIGVEFHGNVYTNHRTDYNRHTRMYDAVVDQSFAAQQNRQTMTNFLTDLVNLLGADVCEYETPYIKEEYLHPLGIKENAQLL